MKDETLKELCDTAVAESLCPQKVGFNFAAVSDTAFQIAKGLKDRFKALGWLEVLKYLPEIVSLIQTMGPKIQEIIEIISTFLERLKPNPSPVPRPGDE